MTNTNHAGLLWAEFPSATNAHRALDRLEDLGLDHSDAPGRESFVQSWLQAIYARVPEGITDGLIAGPLVSLATVIAVQRGLPGLFAIAFFLTLGTLVCVCFGALWGIGYGAYESLVSATKDTGGVAIGVHCSGPLGEQRAAEAFEAAGASLVRR